MEKGLTTTKKKSPVAYVSDEQLETWQRNEELLAVINTHPRKEWIKKHPFNKKVDYLPVGKIEMLLDQIFGVWDFTVVDYKLIGNAVTVHIKLKVKNPKTGEWIERDGLGAVPLELEATEYKEDFKSIASEAKDDVFTIEMENKINSFTASEDLTEYIMEMDFMHENEEFMKAFRNKKTELENKAKK